jgi:hypothetical protein
MELRIDARGTALCLAAIVIVLAVAHVGGMVARYLFDHEYAFGLIDTFNLNFENNVPTFFTTFMLVACAALLAVIARHSAMTDGGATYWKWLALVFLFLAVDEDASLHELLIEPLRERLPMAGPLYFAWVVPYGLAVLVVGLVYLRFVQSLPVRTCRLFVAAGIIYLVGALGFELAGGWYLSQADASEDLRYSLLVAAEESLEMSGIVLFIYALLDHLRQRLGGEALRIRIPAAAGETGCPPR